MRGIPFRGSRWLAVTQTEEERIASAHRRAHPDGVHRLTNAQRILRAQAAQEKAEEQAKVLRGMPGPF